MHLSLQTLSLLGTLTLALAHKDADLGYMKCASAVATSTTFPSCTSSYKLDCFCEAQAQTESKTKEGGQNARARVQLSQDVEDLCADNGVPKEEITRYLCDADAVPASPRRGSAPMVRPAQGQQQQQQQQQEEQGEQGEQEQEQEQEPSNASEEGEKEKEQGTTGGAEPTSLSKRAIAPQNDQGGDTGTDTESGSDAADGDHIAIVTVTVTETESYCAKPTPALYHVPASSSASASASVTPSGYPAGYPAGSPTSKKIGTPAKTSGAVHSAEVGWSSAVAGPSSVVASSIVWVSPVPTGADAGRQHGAEESDGEGEGENQDGELFEGGAVISGVSRGVFMGVLGVVAGFVLL